MTLNVARLGLVFLVALPLRGDEQPKGSLKKLAMRQRAPGRELRFSFLDSRELRSLADRILLSSKKS